MNKLIKQINSPLFGHRQKGKLITWKEDKGFGFIQSETGDDIFIHISALRDSSRPPKIGDRIHYEIARDTKGRLRASNASIEGVKSNSSHTHSNHSHKQNINNRSQYDIPDKKLTLFSIGIIITPFIFSVYFLFKEWNPIPLFLYLIISTITFIAYALDKKRAIDKIWRIPEAYLHLFELLGGWPGALIAQYKIRHKSKKKSYQFIFWMIVAFHIIVWIDYVLVNGQFIIDKFLTIIFSLPS